MNKENKNMNKIYFENDKEAVNHYYDMLPKDSDPLEKGELAGITCIIAKEKGYIRKSTIEEVETILKKCTISGNSTCMSWSDFTSIVQAFGELKEEYDKHREKEK